MRPFALSLAIAFVVTSVAIAQEARMEDLVKAALVNRDSRQVTVLGSGQFYHRHDHLVVTGARQMTPEQARERGYVPCPECLPPDTTAELNDETTGTTRQVTSYYKYYLKERVNPTTTMLPKGAGPVEEKPAAAAAPRAAAAPKVVAGK